MTYTNRITCTDETCRAAVNTFCKALDAELDIDLSVTCEDSAAADREDAFILDDNRRRNVTVIWTIANTEPDSPDDEQDREEGETAEVVPSALGFYMRTLMELASDSEVAAIIMRQS